MSCVGKSIRIQFTLTFKEKHLFCSIFNYICSLIKQSIENKFLIFDFFKKMKKTQFHTETVSFSKNQLPQ